MGTFLPVLPPSWIGIIRLGFVCKRTFETLLFFASSTKNTNGSIINLLVRIRNPPNNVIPDSWVFENFTLADELFGKALRSLKFM